MAEPSKPLWAVALSGGGHRAALYTAGALIAMVDAGVNAQVRTITSVSGGSLTNGMLAQARTPLCEMRERAELTAALQPLLHRATYRGTVEGAPEVYAWAATWLALIGGGTWLEIAHHGSWLAVAAWAALILAGLWVFSARCWVADRVFRRMLFHRDGKPTRLAQAEPPGRTQVLHVFCASELQSRVHAYFSPRFLYCYDFGVSTRFATLPLSTAVQVSSNFPPVFPARRLSARRLGFDRAPATTRRASTLWLSDGGVYDNMAEEWITGAFQREAAARNQVLDHLDGPDPDRLLVVNASKRDDFARRGWLSRVPLLGELLVLVGITNLMHQVTTTNRRSRLIDEFKARQQLSLMHTDDAVRLEKLEHAIGLPGELTHIATPADELARKYPDATDGPLAVVAAAFRACDPEWLRDSHAMALRVGTRLNKTRPEPAAALLWQAHALTQVNLFLAGETTTITLMTKDEALDILRGTHGTN